MLALVGMLAQVDRGDWDHMDGWGGGWMWLWGVAMMVLFVAVIVWLVRATTITTPPGAGGRRDPLDQARSILAERYARGELSTDEYRDRASELR